MLSNAIRVALLLILILSFRAAVIAQSSGQDSAPRRPRLLVAAT
jgi:hypothetical protein